MRKESKDIPQSRRQVQRRFSPGTFVVSVSTGCIVATVVGWSVIAASFNPKTGVIRSSESWEALLLTTSNVLQRKHWLMMEKLMNLDEYEDWYTSP